MSSNSCYGIVEYFGEHEGYRCGYCKGKKSNYSVGLWAHVFSPRDYKEMMDRGWRRSGKYCYKPNASKTCCPQYTIRCSARNFNPTKSHKKVLKNFIKYLKTGKHRVNKIQIPEEINYEPQEEQESDSDEDEEDQDELSQSNADNEGDAAAAQLPYDSEQEQRDKAGQNLKLEKTQLILKNTSPRSSPYNNDPQENSSEKSPVKSIPKGADPSKPKSKKAKVLRLERKMAKRALQMSDPNYVSPPPPTHKRKNKTKNLNDYFQEIEEISKSKDSKHVFSTRLVHAMDLDPQFDQTEDESFNVYKKYQITIHNDKPEKCTRNQWKRFLCNSSITIDGDEESDKQNKYGAYHQQYLIDGKIICVGVIDILPDAVSSVYLYYDPEFSFLSLGTFSALLEIACIQLNKWIPRVEELNYYYMGFYIHSCPKMRYKGQYKPSYLLCPETFTWIPIDKCLDKLNNSKYSRFNDNLDLKDNGAPSDPYNLDLVKILHQGRPIIYKNYLNRKNLTNYEDDVKQYSKLIGIKLAESLLLYRE